MAEKLTNCVLAAARLEYMIARSTLWHSRQVASASVYDIIAASKQPLLKCLLPNSFRRSASSLLDYNITGMLLTSVGHEKHLTRDCD